MAIYKILLFMVLVIGCCFVSLAKKRGEVKYMWKRVINNEGFSESASINSKKKTMVMSSVDPALETSGGYNRSVSLHDFKTGKVALKVFAEDKSEWCFVTDVAQSLKAVVEEASKRQQDGTVAVDDNVVPKTRVTCERMDAGALRKASRNFGKFCKKAGKNVYRLASYSPSVDTQFNVFRYPWPIWCFWWPYEIYLTINIEINIDFGK